MPCAPKLLKVSLGGAPQCDLHDGKVGGFCAAHDVVDPAATCSRVLLVGIHVEARLRADTAERKGLQPEPQSPADLNLVKTLGKVRLVGTPTLVSTCEMSLDAPYNSHVLRHIAL